MALKSLVRQNIFWRSAFVGSGLLVAILLARSLQASVTGSLYYDIALFSFYIQIAGLSLESGINFFAASRKTDGASLSIISISWTLIISILAVSIYLLIGRQLLGIKSEVIDAPMIVAFISGNSLYNYFSALFFAKLDFKTPNLVGTIVNALICLVAGLMLMGKFQLTDEQMIAIFLYSFLLKGIWIAGWHYVSSKFYLKFNFNKRVLSGLLKYSLIACVANSLTFLLYRADYYFVEKYCTTHALGNYIQVSKISQMFFLLPGMMSAVFFPIIAGSSEPLKYINMIRRSSKLTLLISVGGCALLSITGYWLFPFVFGPDFNDMYLPFLLMMPGIIALCSIFHITAFFAARNMIKVNIKGTIISLIILFVLDPIIIPLFGIYGSAAILGLSYLVYTLYMLNAFKNEVAKLKSAAIVNLVVNDSQQ